MHNLQHTRHISDKYCLFILCLIANIFLKKKLYMFCVRGYIQTKGKKMGNGPSESTVIHLQCYSPNTQSLKENSSIAKFNSNQQICTDRPFLSNVLGSSNHKLPIFKCKETSTEYINNQDTKERVLTTVDISKGLWRF